MAPYRDRIPYLSPDELRNMSERFDRELRNGKSESTGGIALVIIGSAALIALALFSHHLPAEIQLFAYIFLSIVSVLCIVIGIAGWFIGAGKIRHAEEWRYEVAAAQQRQNPAPWARGEGQA